LWICGWACGNAWWKWHLTLAVVDTCQWMSLRAFVSSSTYINLVIYLLLASQNYCENWTWLHRLESTSSDFESLGYAQVKWSEVNHETKWNLEVTSRVVNLRQHYRGYVCSPRKRKN
jgi:hypothetical protein